MTAQCPVMESGVMPLALSSQCLDAKQVCQATFLGIWHGLVND